MVKILYASGGKGRQIRADGNGGVWPRGYYVQDDTGAAGPFSTEANAVLASEDYDCAADHPRAFIKRGR